MKEAGSFVAHKTGLTKGTKAPHFEAKDQHGNRVSLNDFHGKQLILYFYPKDNTPACTATACSLRDNYKTLIAQGYAVVGISADSEKSHGKFAQKYALPFSILADTDMKIIKDYYVWGTKMLFGRIYDGIVRTTFIVDGDGVIEQVINEVDTKNHAQQILSL